MGGGFRSSAHHDWPLGYAGAVHSSEGLCVPQSCSPVRDRFRGPFRTGSLALQSLALRARARQPRDRAQQGRVRSFCLRACVVMRCGDDREDQEVPLLRSGLLWWARAHHGSHPQFLLEHGGGAHR